MVLGVDICSLPNGTVAPVTEPYKLFGQFVPFILVTIKIVEHPPRPPISGNPPRK